MGAVLTTIATIEVGTFSHFYSSSIARRSYHGNFRAVSDTAAMSPVSVSATSAAYGDKSKTARTDSWLRRSIKRPTGSYYSSRTPHYASGSVLGLEKRSALRLLITA